MKQIIRSFLLLLSVFSLLSFMDDDPFTSLLQKLNEFAKKNPQEKVYLHFDKPYYAIGDNIWFKAYVIDSRTSLPSTTSNILYVELINDRDSIAKKIKLPMQSGITWGDFKLADSLGEGNYRVRAYTQWMRNAGTHFFFDKTIKIGNGWTNKIFTKTEIHQRNVNEQEQIIATITLTNATSKPFVNAIVDYQVILGDKKTTSKKVVTNNQGEFQVNVVNAVSNPIKNGYILAKISTTDGKISSKHIPFNTAPPTFDVQFFPEGGHLVEGLPCKLAVKAINANGLGENISGIISDNEGTKILNFETTYAGMGSFTFTSMPGKTYIAKITSKNGLEKNIDLPKAQKSGYALAINNLDSSKMNIKVMLTADVLNTGDLHLLAQHNGNILFSGKIPTVKQIASLQVQKSQFPSGIVQFTLFNAQNKPVCERLTFVNNLSDKINVEVENLKSSYTKKGLVAISILASNNNKPVPGSFSIAVTNTTVVEPDLDNESNILTQLLLTSDLIGYVEKPNRYFLGDLVATKIHLDDLLLTQGWRKIDWSAINGQQEMLPKYPAEKSMKISGTVIDNGKPVVKGKVSLLSSSQGIFASETETDANGHFIFDQIAFNENTKFALKAITSKEHKGVKIIMDDLPAPLVIPNQNRGDLSPNVNETLKSYLKQSTEYFNEQEAKGFLTRVNQLNTVEIVAKANKAAPSSSNLNGPGVADAVFNAEEMKNSFSISQFLAGKIRTRFDGSMAIYLDGVRYNGVVDDISILEVESIEVLKSLDKRFLYGAEGMNGVLIVTTKVGKERTTFNTRAPGMLAYNPQGFYKVRQFYSPKYIVKQDEIQDFRPTVFWEPNLVTDASGKGNLNYYNTNQTGTFRVVIEGIDAEGNLARKILTYTVN